MVRPRKEIDWKRFQDHCSFQCTQEEIAGKLGIDRETLRKRVKDHYKEDYSAVYKKYSAEGLASLRSQQFHLAKTNASMAIFLGKVLLKQREDSGKSDEIRDLLIELLKSGKGEKLKKALAQEDIC